MYFSYIKYGNYGINISFFFCGDIKIDCIVVCVGVFFFVCVFMMCVIINKIYILYFGVNRVF